MRNQAICYIKDTEISGNEREAFGQKEQIRVLNESDPMGDWSAIMDQLSGMELPKILNERDLWEEVPLSNPADWVYGLAGSDLLYLCGVDLQSISSIHISLEDYISHRQINSKVMKYQDYKQGEEEFLSYLFTQMGYLGCLREGSLLGCQLEYIVGGEESDWQNVRTVAEKIFLWRFADNVACAFSDGNLRAQAISAAEELQAVSLKEEFKVPVADSILYACAFMESIGDLRAIYSKGVVPVRKSGHQMSVSHVLNGDLYTTENSYGFSYKQYLASMILLSEETNVNLRSMDIMEMDIRFQDGNQYFAMDWCIEWYEADISARGSHGTAYYLKRKYGYF